MNESKVIEIIECAGTPYEIGLQYGMAGISFLQESLELCVDTLINFSNITMNAELSKDEILTTAGKFFFHGGRL